MSAISILKDHCFQCAIKKPRIVHLLYIFIVFTGLFFSIKCLGLPIKKMTWCSVSFLLWRHNEWFLFTHKFRLIHGFLLCLLELVYYKVTILILLPVRLVLSSRCHEEFTNWPTTRTYKYIMGAPVQFTVILSTRFTWKNKCLELIVLLLQINV